MAYTEIKGNIFNTKAHAIGNTVNCVGVMGKGIALEFKRRYPQMFKIYQVDCETRKLEPGHVYYYPTSTHLILNITTKNHWKYPSKIEWIESALEQLVSEYRQKRIASLAVPLLGAQSGKLNIVEVKKLMRSYLQDLTDIDIEVYDFDPRAGDPLFEKLKQLTGMPDAELILQEIGAQPAKAALIVKTVRSQEVTSLFMLSESGFIGEKLLDKLYSHLTQLDSEASDVKQLSLFD